MIEQLVTHAKNPHVVLFLGRTGFVGANLSRTLAGAGHSVFVTGKSIVKVELPESVRPASLMLDAAEEIAAFAAHKRVDTVVQLVSSLKPSGTWVDYLVKRDTVLTQTLRLANVLADLGSRLIYLSSGRMIYSATSGRRAAENDTCKPISVYGQSKLGIELHLGFLQRTRGLRSLIIRPSNPYGSHQSLHGTQGLVSVLLGCVAQGRGLEVSGDGSSVRDYLHVDDLTATIRARRVCDWVREQDASFR